MNAPRPLFLYTDFGWSGPYVGQLLAAALAVDPRIPVVSLMHDAPAMRPELAAYLLPASCRTLPAGAVVVAVVDPGVGGERAALIVDTGELTLVGPDNGLLSRFGAIRQVQRIEWRPDVLSRSFHGRDLFVPVAARIAMGESIETAPLAPARMVGADWPAQQPRVIYIDAFGNAMTGLSAENMNKNNVITAGGHRLAWAETFCSVAPGEAFWYFNSQGLVEIAASGGSAAAALSLALGDELLVD
jgi:S-adenosylmethionine hydrolase